MVVEQAQRVFLVGVAIQVLLTTEHSYVIVGPALEAPGKDCGERKRRVRVWGGGGGGGGVEVGCVRVRHRSAGRVICTSPLTTPVQIDQLGVDNTKEAFVGEVERHGEELHAVDD